jgi:hypothetical protein
MIWCGSPLVRNLGITKWRPVSHDIHLVSLHRRISNCVKYDKGASTLEIEMKFRSTPAILEYCTLHSTQIEEIELCDVYFDSAEYELTKHDLWLRSRNGVLELKAPPCQTVTTDGNGVSSLDFYIESTQLAGISRTLFQHTQLKIDFTPPNDAAPACSSPAEALRRADIHPFGTIVSRRRRHLLRVPLSHMLLRRWNQSELFCHHSPLPVFQDVFVDLDFVSYVTPDQQVFQKSTNALAKSVFECSDYQIGEIEFVNSGLVSILDGAASAATPEERVGFQQALMRGVCDTLGVVDLSPVRGKVLEYLHRLRPAHYQALRDCGQLASKGI